MTVRLDPEMHRSLVEVFWYLENRGADIIDPDMFRIEVEKVRALQRLFRAELETYSDAATEPPEEVAITSEELWTLDYYVMAAEAYSTRRTEQGLMKVDDEEWEHLREWISRARQLFRPH